MTLRKVKKQISRIFRHFVLADKRGPNWWNKHIPKGVVEPIIRLDHYGVNGDNMEKFVA